MQVYSDIPFASDVFTVASPFTDALRSIGYGLLEILSHALDAFYNAVTTMLGINIMEIEAVQTFVNSISPVAWAVLTLAVIFAAIALMIWPTKKEMLRGFCLAILLMLITPMLFTTLEGVKNAGVGSLSSTLTATGDLGQTVLTTNTIDVLSSTLTNSPEITYIGDSNSNLDPYSLDINARLPEGRVSTTDGSFSREYKWKVENKIVSPDGTIVHNGSELGNGFFGWGAERLYAYQFDFVGTLLMLLIMIIALFFSAFKVGKTIYDLVVHEALAPVVFASDIQGAGRTKKFLQSLVSNYIILIMVLLLLRMYMTLMMWICSTDYGIWVKVFLIGGASWGIIDGPDVILKILGVDAGTKSATGLLMGAAAVGSIAKNAGSTVSGAARAVSQVPQAAAGAAGHVTGAAQGIRNFGGNAQMGQTLATNPQARMDAGVNSAKEMREGMSASSNSASTSPNGQPPSQPAGYNNTPERAGYFARIRDSYTGARDRTSTSIDKAAATVGYGVGSIQNRAAEAKLEKPNIPNGYRPTDSAQAAKPPSAPPVDPNRSVAPTKPSTPPTVPPPKGQPSSVGSNKTGAKPPQYTPPNSPQNGNKDKKARKEG